MRLILLLLAIANFRWAGADLARSDRLYAEADAAYARSEARVRLAEAQAREARLFA